MADPATQTEIATIKVISPAFGEGQMIPQQYTCDGDSISPPLNWEAIPEGTKSIVLIMDDPDAPGGTFVHCVLYDLPADLEGLPENLPPGKGFPIGGKEGINSTKKTGYEGPCPPSGWWSTSGSRARCTVIRAGRRCGRWCGAARGAISA